MSENKSQNELPKSIVGFLDKYSTKLWNGVKPYYKKASNEVRRDWHLGYERYLNKAGIKYFYATTFLTYNQPRPLYDLYVPLSVRCGKDFKEETSINDLLDENRYSIIMATGGSGKTMMMRHLFVDSIENTSKVPIFIELRDLNNTELTLFELIKKKLKDFEFNFGDEYLEIALKAGHFTLLLDGFDEVADAKRKATMQQIEDIADTYEKNNIIISSRPDESLNQWELFNIWQVHPLTLEQACELVKRTDTDEGIKEKFTKALKEELFEKHESFLANPLLLAIMLITYKDSAKIPDKISTFYEQAYTALFYQHDARKSFDRPKRTNLDMLDFKKVFSAFCFFTYNKNQFNFTQTEVFEYLEKAKKYTGIDFKNKAFLQDLLQSVCLMVRDGLNITFSHRSFQEYFAAIFTTKMEASLRKKSIENLLSKNIFISNIHPYLSLLFEISPEIVESDFLIPKLVEIEEIINYSNSFDSENYKNLLKLLLKSARLSKIVRGAKDNESIDNYELRFIVKSTEHDLAISYIVFNYLEPKKKLIDKKSTDEFYKAFKSKYKNNVTVLIEELIADEDLFIKLTKYGRISKNILKNALKIKTKLIVKHKERKQFLENEFFN